MANVSNEIYKYAIYAASYLINQLSEDETRMVHNVILFGSAAQKTATADSDIDIFFDIDASKSFRKRLKIRLNKAAAEFYLHNLAFEFRLKNIANEISITIGKLSEMPELQKSIASTGILLYGHYFLPIKEKAQAIFSIEKIRKNEGALLNKLYGYKSGKKHYFGLIKKISGFKLGRAFVVPAEQKQSIIEILKKYKVDYSLYDAWM